MDSARFRGGHPRTSPRRHHGLLPDLASIPAILGPRLRPGDIVLTGAGSITELGPRLLSELARNRGGLAGDNKRQEEGQ